MPKIVADVDFIDYVDCVAFGLVKTTKTMETSKPTPAAI
jgi:hypothetical protein